VRRLEGKVALVTGGARGIGEAIVERLAAEGAAVVVADVLASEASAVAARLGPSGSSIAVDLTSLPAITEMVDEAAAWRGRLDVLVNNAGVARPASILSATADEWDVQVAVNLRAPFFATQAAARHMAAAGGGKVVNTVSTSGFVSSSTPEPIYDLTKGGLRQLTISAAVELAPMGINVNGVAPGTIGTVLTHTVLDTPEKMARSIARIPCGRLGQPSDVAAAVAYLSSSDADYLYGTIVNVDGGWLAV
jgi:NAD(P)-dependent dehydrogenase (short-subunit alcohol dehydrogenase family)